MKKFLGFLFLLLILIGFIYGASTVYVCESGSTVNLKSLGIDYSCSCIKVDGKEMVCTKNQ